MSTPLKVAPSARNWVSRPLIYLLLAGGLILSVLPLGGTPKVVERTRVFPASGLRVTSPFVEVWELPGSYPLSLAVSGEPLTDRRPETRPGSTIPREVQWFARARYEWYPEQAPPNDVQLGALGQEATATRQGEPAFAPVPRPADPAIYWFAETQHTLRGPFLEFWLKYGSWKQFGLSISEELVEPGAGGKAYTVQYLERARLELHPGESPTTGDVIVGELGRELYKP